MIGKYNEIIQGDALTVLKTMPSNLVQCVVTSPPYWGLRDYGEAGQLGLEATPEEYVARMVKIFAEVRRVLRDDGTLWLNLGDSYGQGGGTQVVQTKNASHGLAGYRHKTPNIKPKDLCGIPWRVAFALQADGWYLRSDIIWSKPNPMPESVTDRPTKAHEYVFLLTKRSKYYYDVDAIREPQTGTAHSKGKKLHPPIEDAGVGHKDWHRYTPNVEVPGGRNRRTVWEIATQPYPEAHFATFPEKLVEPCILAGSNDRACGICGAAWEREVKTEYIPHGESAKSGGDYAGDRNSGDLTHGKFRPQEMKYGRATRKDTTLGFRPTCAHDNGDSRSIILDPFMGSGTVALVALKLGRDYIGIELKPDYIAMTMKRLKPLGNRPLPQQEILI